MLYPPIIAEVEITCVKMVLKDPKVKETTVEEITLLETEDVLDEHKVRETVWKTLCELTGEQLERQLEVSGLQQKQKMIETEAVLRLTTIHIDQGEDLTSYKFSVDKDLEIDDWMDEVKRKRKRKDMEDRERRRQKLMAKIMRLERNYFTQVTRLQGYKVTRYDS